MALNIVFFCYKIEMETSISVSYYWALVTVLKTKYHCQCEYYYESLKHSIRRTLTESNYLKRGSENKN